MTSSPKRKLSVSSIPDKEIEASPTTKRRQQMSTSAAPPPMVALPPPLMQYPNGQIVSVVHHGQQPYYQMYHHPHPHQQQQPFYYPVSPQQHSFITHPSPTLEPTNTVIARKSSTPRILPKNPEAITSSPLSSPAAGLYPQPPPSPFYHPYALQISPTMMPSYPPVPPPHSSRNNSVSSSPGLGPTSTADQREKARKVSHSAIERRRRERINDKILQLKQLIPSCAEQDNLHKMSILQSAIDYISYLKEIVKSLDEHGTEATTNQLLKGDHLRVKTVKSMLPKEVEPFTTQFSVHTKSTSIPQEEEEENQDKGGGTNQKRLSEIIIVQHNQRGLKPMDVIKSGTPIISTTPLTPPQEPVKSSDNNQQETDDHHATSPSSTVSLSPALKPDEAKHMSLQNILC